jgi:hypothetical protein
LRRRLAAGRLDRGDQGIGRGRVEAASDDQGAFTREGEDGGAADAAGGAGDEGDLAGEALRRGDRSSRMAS